MAGIVSTEWLAAHLQQPEQRIFDARNSFSLYYERHVPGAQFLHLETLRMSEGGMPCRMLPLPMLGVIFGRLGITANTPVILYSADPDDHLSATYEAWSLAVSGNPNVFLLDGGMMKWTSDHLPVTQAFPTISEEYYQTEFDADIFADWRYVLDHLHADDVVLVDSRTRNDYTGDTAITQRRGHIPGAILYDYTWNFQSDGTYQSLETMRQRYQQFGITPDKEVISYCVTGREGSSNWFVLKYLLDYPRVRLYQASLTEWTAHSDLPMVTGSDPWGTSAEQAA